MNQFMRLCAAAISFYSDASADGVEERSLVPPALSAQAERDNESCFFVRAAGVHRLIRRYHVNNNMISIVSEVRQQANHVINSLKIADI
ncbi:hypothetical protein EVAR_98400_1 [Eumeta japonica]|uniref:Uncharacterized protein n=1 Tax=Eumeta variegata TaxID=151549 RepID=A0A4C1XU20_EUMVA|nr:hypothetical protein EVAR_98400_1 [Eumeta japonica]